MSSYTFSPGHDVVGRYRITDTVGVGSTAEVYLAEDQTLHRTVILKVLLPQLAAHEDVRRTFRDQIIRSATLSHPHLARVFDGGQESGSIFVVSEYMSGGSLEDVLASGRRLDVGDTAKLGGDVASALAYLHANGLVHGSLSPSKLLIGDDGGVRIGDVAMAGLRTMHAGHASINDVRYLSPEQAQGAPGDAKSDVYALALILFEVATGEAPFDAVSAEAMLRARINTPLPIRPELGTLDMILAQAAVPDPLLRLSADQLANRLSASVTDPSPLVITPASRSKPLLAHYQPSEPRTSIGFRVPSAKQIVGAGYDEPPATRFPRPQPARSVPPGSPAADARARARASEPYPIVPPPRRRRATIAVAALVLVAAAAGAAVWKSGLLTQSHTVPSLLGLTTSEAASQLSGEGLSIRVASHQRSATIAAHEIISQSPAAGSSAKAGSVVTVTVSDGQARVTMPSVLGDTCATATAVLKKAGVTATCPSTAVVASNRAAGQVAGVIYHGFSNPTSVPAGATVVLALSKGPTATTTTAAPVTTTTAAPTTSTTAPATTTTVVTAAPRPVPNVIGMDQSQTFAAFKKAVLFFRTKGPGSSNGTWTTVVSTIPAPGTMVPYRSTIIVNVK
ncbi:MAG: protein kinase [Actinomycetales bacterium]|nr:protein kinase [Actinomycetales bacterium]